MSWMDLASRTSIGIWEGKMETSRLPCDCQSATSIEKPFYKMKVGPEMLYGAYHCATKKQVKVHVVKMPC